MAAADLSGDFGFDRHPTRNVVAVIG